MGFLDRVKKLEGDLRQTVKTVQEQLQSASEPAESPTVTTPAEPYAAPTRAEVMGANADSDGTKHRMTDWDRWDTLGDAVPWKPDSRRFVIADDWEALIFAGPDNHEIQLITLDLATFTGDDASLRAGLADATDRDEPYGAQLFAVGRDAEGLPTAVCAIADLVFYARVVGDDDVESAFRVVRAALDALPG